MYKAILIEDEHKLREALFLMLQYVAAEKVNVIAVAENVVDAIQLIDELQPNLVFMDIQLKDGSGFDVLEYCSFKNFHVIFTTAYQEYAIKAFKTSAIDYLLKPIDPAELKAAIDKISVLEQKFLNRVQLSTLQNSLGKPSASRISLSTQEGLHLVAINDIIYCQTSGSYTTFHLVNDREIIVSKPLKNYEGQLTLPDFFRIHQTYLVNLNFVETYLKDGMVILKNKIELPVAQRKKDEFLKLIRL
ncbi:LytR/AlgR family response regulator transcription factor [Pedobacter cryoconitis]|uniref:Two-component system LytT family response regulator n=1 Tax=Pedobacter cryoconitis TaxID=188932 RepID=A0A7X0J2F7_9SPHI|nr:LytTR family DNA-binding domain-containing protein [Pedobacter cryoconitis]MBB6499192.1 two-component system LytT family response regulator [Pedobacter cryoconitis]